MKKKISTLDLTTISEFVTACKTANVRLVKLMTDAFVEPGDAGAGAIGLIGKERIVLTAFDKASRQLFRWRRTEAARSMVTIVAGTGRGYTDRSVFAAESLRIRRILELDGMQVVDGEWVESDINALLAEESEGGRE